MRSVFWLACVVVCVLALLPDKYLQYAIFNIWDKAQHALTFAALTLLGLSAYPSARRNVLIGLILYGGAIELAQGATGWRDMEFSDFVADAIGVTTAWLSWRYLIWR